MAGRFRQVVLVVVSFLTASHPADGTNAVDYALTDIRVLYACDEASAVDWPVLYYLNEEFSCRIDVLSLGFREASGYRSEEIADRQIYFHRLHIADIEQTPVDSLFRLVCRERYPDIVILNGQCQDKAFDAVRRHILQLQPGSQRFFNVLKIFEREIRGEGSSPGQAGVTLNTLELFSRYRGRISLEVPTVDPGYQSRAAAAGGLVTYRLSASHLEEDIVAPDFLDGIDRSRLVLMLDRHLSEGPKRQTLRKQVESFLSSFEAALRTTGHEKTRLVVDGFRTARDLGSVANFGEELESMVDFRPYLQGVIGLAERAALETVGLLWQGDIVVRDSPHGPKVKFRLLISANGPEQIELGSVKFHPYWDSATVILDSIRRTIAPHQSYVREYRIDIDRERLEARQPESLSFSVEIAFGDVPMVLARSLRVGQVPGLAVSFEPHFYFVPPVPELDIDRVVSSTNLRVVITKPRDYAAGVHIDLATPRGLFAGAYRQEIDLDKGVTHRTVQIPFSISKLFELGIQPLYITMTAGGVLVSKDTGYVRVAACHVDEKTKITFLPDSTGLLEDILRVTDAGFQPLTDRGLLTADLEAFDVIIIGSGAFRRFPSLGMARDRMKKFISNGGSVVVMGQPDDWPEGVLPVSLIPRVEVVAESQIVNPIPDDRILSKPYRISDNSLRSSFGSGREASSAVVSPAEKVYISASGGALLSISRFNRGQIIYCGFPLLEMISGLEINAIHLLANILNY